MIPEHSGQQQNIETSWDFVAAIETFPSQNYQHIALPSGVEILSMEFETSISMGFNVSMDHAPITFAFHLAGHGSSHLSYSSAKNQIMIAEPGKVIISFNPETNCRTNLLDQQHYRVVNIYISPSQLFTQLEEQLDQVPYALHSVLENPDFYSHHTPYNHAFNMSPHTIMLLDQIYNCPYHGVLRKIFLESKSMELIVRQLWEITQAPLIKKNRQLTPIDISRIHDAKEMLIGDFKNPPSLKELAKRAGLNDTKLKQGFRQVFGITAYECFRRHRINKAREMLREGKFNVDEVSYLLGFHDTPHFINRFRNYFGTTPGKYIKKHHSSLF